MPQVWWPVANTVTLASQCAAALLGLRRVRRDVAGDRRSRPGRARGSHARRLTGDLPAVRYARVMTFDHIGLVVVSIDAEAPRLADLLQLARWTARFDDHRLGVSVCFGSDAAGV